MSHHVTSVDYSEDDFAGTGANKSTIALLYTGATPTNYMLDGTVIGPQSDLGSLKATIAEFEADDADGSADPAERVLVTAGGVVCTRSADGSTLAIAPRPPVPFARAVALRVTLASLSF